MQFKENIYEDYINNITDIHFRNKFDIEKDYYISMYKDIKNDGLKITRTYFSIIKTNIRGNKYIRKNNYTQDIITFIVLCNNLKKYNIDIKPLINEFNQAQKNTYIYDVLHTLTLGKLSYEYLNNNYKIKFVEKIKNKKSPDIKINEIYADLKVRKEIDTDLRFLKHFQMKKLPSGYFRLPVDASLEFQEDIGRSISSRGSSGLQQADALFIDLSYRWGQIPNNIENIYPVPPQKNSIIFFISNHSHTKIYQQYVWAHTLWDSESNDFTRQKDRNISWL